MYWRNPNNTSPGTVGYDETTRVIMHILISQVQKSWLEQFGITGMAMVLLQTQFLYQI